MIALNDMNSNGYSREYSRIFSSTPFRLAVSLLIGALTLYLSLKDISLQQVSQAIAQVDWIFYGLAFLSVMLNTAAKAARWKVLMGAPGRQVAFSRVFMGITIGHTLNTAYPARAGDIARAYVIGKRGLDKAYLLGTVVVEKVLDLLAYALLIVCLVLLIPLPKWIGQPFTGLIILATALGATTVVALKNRSWIVELLNCPDRLPAWLARWLPSRLSRMLQAGFSSVEVLQNRRAWPQLVGWSGVIWGTAVLTNLLMLWAVRLQVTDFFTASGVPTAANLLTGFTASLLTLVLLQVGIALPSTPGRIGVFEYICVLALGLFGVSQAPAFIYGILLHAVVFLPPTLLGLYALVAFGLLREKNSLVFMQMKGDEVLPVEEGNSHIG
jgi:uncharacterized protein (TIRG00374 family)